MMTISSTLGWFSRIVTMTVEIDGPVVVDEGEEFIIPWDSFTGKVNLLDINGSISGRVKITVMDGMRIWHTGIVLNLEQYLHYLDPFVSSDLCAREMRITIDTDTSEGCWLEGTIYLNFSIPLGRQKGDQDCYAFYSMNTISLSYNGITGSGNNDSSRSGSRSESGSGSSTSNVDGNHVASSSSSNQHNQDRIHGPSSKFIVKDTILSPSTSGTTRDFKTCNATRGADHRVDRYSSSSSSSLSLSNNNTGLDQQQQHHQHINDRSGNYGRTSQDNNNNSSSNSSSVLDVCRWIPTYTGEAFGLRHSLTVTLTRPWYAHSPEIYVPLKLYSTVQDSSMTTSLHDDEEEDEEDVSYNNPKPLHLILVDFCGLCSLSIPSRWIDLDKPVTCKVTFRDYTVPVVSMHLLLIRTEYIHDAHKDSIIFVHRVFGQAAQELLEAVPSDALHSSGYVAREDINNVVDGIALSGHNIPRNVPRGGDDPVCSGDGVCATFLFDFPMGNNPQNLNNNNSSGGNTGNPGDSRCAVQDSSTVLKSVSFPAPSSSSISGPPSSSSEIDNTISKIEGNNVINPTLSVPSSSTASSSSSSSSSSLSYRERVQKQKAEEQEVEKRRSRLYPSFDSCQQDGTPFSLYVGVDSDDESSEGGNDEDEQEDEVRRANDRGVRGGSAERRDVTSEIGFQNISLQDDPERGGGGDGGGSEEENNGEALRGPKGTGDDGDRDDDLADQYMRAEYRKKLKIARAEERKKSKKIKPYFDFLGDSVSVRYFFRLIIEDGEGECKWNTTEVVLFRAKAPYFNMSDIDSDTTAVV